MWGRGSAHWSWTFYSIPKIRYISTKIERQLNKILFTLYSLTKGPSKIAWNMYMYTESVHSYNRTCFPRFVRCSSVNFSFFLDQCVIARVGIPRLWEQIHPHSLASQPPLQMRTDAVLIHEWACKIVLKFLCSCLIKGTLINYVNKTR